MTLTGHATARTKKTFRIIEISNFDQKELVFCGNEKKVAKKQTILFLLGPIL